MTRRASAGRSERLRALLQRRQRVVSGAWLALGLAVALLMPSGIASILYLNHVYGAAQPGWDPAIAAAETGLLRGFIAAGLLAGGAAAALVGRNASLTRSLVRELQGLATGTDGEELSALIDLWSDACGRVRRAVRDTLLTRLRSIKRSSAESLTEWQRAALHSTFRGDDEELVMAACGALALAGRRDAIGPLERLSAGQTYALARRERVRAAAAEALDALRERLTVEMAHAHLLRPAGASPEDTLLRAAACATDDDEELLRPAAPASDPVHGAGAMPSVRDLEPESADLRSSA